MHHLPPQGHPAREMFAVEDLVAIATRQVEPMVDRWRARCQARRMFAADKAIRRVCFIIIRADNDQLELISVGRGLGIKVEWRFQGGLAPRQVVAA